MDLESAAPTPSRRHLLGAIGAAGLAGAATLAIARPAAAAPSTPTDADKAILRPVMEMELAAHDLYLEAAAAGLSEEATAVATEFAANHAAYADEIAGAAGFSATGRDDELFDEHAGDFGGSNDAAFAATAAELENAASATHLALFPEYESASARKMSASIAIVEARMATVLIELGGDASDLDALLEPDAQPIDVEGSGA